MPSPPHPATPDVVRSLRELGTWERTFHADRAAQYLADIRETLPLYRSGAIAHPGWLVRTANFVLGDNVALGPWIHVESRTQHHGLLVDGDRVATHATVVDEYERKGHRFVELDVVVVANGAAPVASIRHIAIYRPRPVAAVS